MNNIVISKTSWCNGKGVCVNKDFKKGEVVFEFNGNLVSFSKVIEQSLQISKNKWVKPYSNSPGYFLNHSCNPNCGIKNLNEIIAMKPIKKGEEITIDYSTNSNERDWKMKCKCKNANCRKIIRAYKFLPKKLKAKYKGWESDYLRNV